MTETQNQADHWIKQGKDPRVAHWQTGLEAMMEAFQPYLTPGWLTPVTKLAPADRTVFEAVLKVADISPNLWAAFLPPALANKMVVPEVLPKLQRIAPDQPSYKLLIQRPAAPQRIFCAEVSEQAHLPGAEIFQEGQMLGSYDFDSQEALCQSLQQILRAHIWEKQPWPTADYRRYTGFWLDKVLALQSGEVAVDLDHSYLHTPSLVKSDRVTALFTLIGEVLDRLATDPQSRFAQALAEIARQAEGDLQTLKRRSLVETQVLELLTAIKTAAAVDFSDFSPRENEQFKQETEKTIRWLVRQLEE